MSLRLGPLDLATLDALSVEAYAVFLAPDERPLWGLGGLLDWRLCGRLSRLLEAGQLVGSAGEAMLTTTSGMLPGSRIFLFGQGEPSMDGFKARARSAARALALAGVSSLAVGLPEHPDGAEATVILAEALGELSQAEVTLFGALGPLQAALPGVAVLSA